MFASKDDGVRHCTLSKKKQRARIIDVSLTVFISGVVVLEVLLVPVLVAVLDVLVVGSSVVGRGVDSPTATGGPVEGGCDVVGK